MRTSRLPRTLTRLAACLWLVAMASASQAGSLAISPMVLNFNADRGIAVITLTNTSRETMTLENEALPWPENAADQSSRDLTVNPPIVTITPGGRATVRVGLVKRLPATVERTYRMYFTELPSPRPQEAMGVGVRLRVGIPVFIAADSPQTMPLTWRAKRDGDAVLLTAHNPGNVHQRVHQVQAQKGEVIYAATQGLPYVLANGDAGFRLPAAAITPGAPLKLQVRGDDGITPIELALP